MSTTMTFAPPAVEIPVGCEIRELPFKIGSGRTLASKFTLGPSGSIDAGENRIRLRVFFRASDGHLIGRVWFGDGAEGPPGHVHGGASAYILDEVMGSVGWMNRIPILAAHLDFDYFQPTPLFHDLTVEAWLGPIKGRRISVHSRLMLDEKICVQGHGEFAVIPRSKISDLADPNDPEIHALIIDPRLRWAAE